ncbi:DUF4139 domain-containing protein [Arenibacterium sp. CAU 1754]
MAVWADTIPVASPVTHVTVYTQGATIIRRAPFSVPQGKHDLILYDIPATTDLSLVRVTVEGVRAGPITLRSDFVPPRDADKSPEVQAAENRVEQIERQIQSVQDRAAQARLAGEAAKTSKRFLGDLGKSEGMADADLSTLRALSQLVGEEALAASQTAHNGEVSAKRIERDLKDLNDDLDAARQALTALTPESDERAMIAVEVEADAATDGTVTVTYLTYEAQWQPVYDLHLTRGETASLAMERGAFVRQETGENWTDVNLTLSTVRPANQIQPSRIYSERRRIVDPLPPGNYGSLAEPIMETPVVVEEASARVNLDGYAVVYEYPNPVTITTDADAVRLRLDELTMAADVAARAVPSRDDTAFVMAHVKNTSQELILPAYIATLYVDGVFVGNLDDFGGIPAGDEADIPFGPINGLRLKRTVLNQNEGGRGIISKSNERSQLVRIDVSNLGNDTWPVTVLDRVPYSNQEDLEITWSADPAPKFTNYEDRRGILAWDMTLKPGETRTIELKQTLSWPEGKELR